MLLTHQHSRALFALPFIFSSSVRAGKANTFEPVGNTGVSAQQLFLGMMHPNKVYIVDKVENNPITIAGHPAWATEYDTETNEIRAMDIITNSFCAGGNVLGNGSWLNVGGNNAVQEGGISNTALNLSDSVKAGDYKDLSGGRARRIITPCSDETCTWNDDLDGMPKNRWYPTVETLEDGSALIIGGELWGGFVNAPDEMQNVPTYEYFPSRGDPVNSTFLEDSQPANLYPLTWLLPDGHLFMQGSWLTTLINHTTSEEIRLPNMTHAQRTYPGAGATTMLPLTVGNNYTATILFCGGMDPKRDDWNQLKWEVINTKTSTSCVSINPLDASPVYTDEDDLPEARGMGNFIILPDRRMFLVNGASYGSEGYGWQNWTQGQSYARNPVNIPSYYNHSAPAGQRWDNNLPASTINRMYHSSATLLPDGSVFIAGSNPNADVITEANNASYPYKTEYRAERFYPDYYDAPRPNVTGIPASISYGGDGFDLTLPSTSLNGSSLDNIFIGLMRTGFSTHAMNMGMKYVELQHSYTANKDGSATLHVAQFVPNPAVMTPGPALLFVVVNGIPSIGQPVMLGSGNIETQVLNTATVLPASRALSVDSTKGTGTAGSAGRLVSKSLLGLGVTVAISLSIGC